MYMYMYETEKGRKEKDKIEGTKSYKEGFECPDVSKEDGNVQEHDNITDGNGSHVCLTLSVNLISNSTLHKIIIIILIIIGHMTL